MGKTFHIVIIHSLFSLSWGSIVFYGNDYDNPIISTAGVVGVSSGGNQTTRSVTSGVTDSQGYDNYDAFSGDFYRIATEDDRLIIQVSGLDPTIANSLSFSLAMIDSWDGGDLREGNDILNTNIHDGGTIASNMVSGGVILDGFSVIYDSSGSFSGASFITSTVVENEQLGFRNNQTEEGYTVQFDGLIATSGILTFEIWASSGGTGRGFEGGSDESFAIDNFAITGVPEPRVTFCLVLAGCTLAWRRRRTLN